MTGAVQKVRDESEQLRIEAELRESEQRYRSLLETSPDIYWSTDGSGRSEYVSPNLERITGFDREELAAGPALWLSRVDPRHALALESVYSEAIVGTHDDSARGGNLDFEYRFRRKDNRWIWLRARSYFRATEHGKLRVHFVTSEITKRKELEQREAARHAITRVIAEARDLAEAFERALPHWCDILEFDLARIWTLDEGGKLRSEARCSAQLRGDGGEAMQLPPEQVWFSAREHALSNAEVVWLDRSPMSEPGFGAGIVFPLAGGNRVLGVFECFAREARSKDPQLEELAKDIGDQLGGLLHRRRADSKLRKLEDELRQAQKMEAIGQLAGGIAHDFNNLLGIVLMTTSVLGDDLAPGDPRREDVDEIRCAAERAAELTRRLLTFSRRSVVEPIDLDLGAVVTGMEKLLRRVLGADVDLATKTASDLGRVCADAGQIEQVLLNLAVNARDAMPNGGALTIETTNVELDQEFAVAHAVRPGSFVALVVSDTGFGMTAAVKQRIFEPFFTTKELDRGTGLGLATVYGIVKQAGGCIWVYSEPGRGSSFKVYLPRIDSRASTRPARKRERAVAHGSETLLVVDDEDSLRNLMARVLGSLGYTVLAAANSTEALAIAEGYGGTIDGLITDVVLPGVSGPEIACRFGALRPAAKVLYVSGFADHARVRSRLIDPGSCVLQKPFSGAALGAKVRELFSGAKARVS